MSPLAVTTPSTAHGEGDIQSLLADTLEYSRARDYEGYDKADGLSSPLVRILPFDSKWVNIAVQEGVKRAPVNLRPLLLVPQRRSFMGAALFARANLTMFERTGQARYRADARSLLEWLVENRSRGYTGFCGGHRHPVQGLDGKTPPDTPGIVGTAHAVRALLRGEHLGTGYDTLAESAADYVFSDLGYEECPAGARIRYKPTDTGDYYTLNANAVGARMFADLYDRFGTATYREAAERILAYVASRQTDRGGWMYRDPPEASHVSMDNYHNGFILDAFQRYGEVADPDRFADTLSEGLRFYRRELFDGPAPCWDEANSYPRDIHGASQGIIVFARTGGHRRARRVIDWVLDTLYAGDGQFYYQRRRYYTKRFTLMRWCQAWMAVALATYLHEAS